MDKLSELFMQICRSTPRYRDMALLFPRSKKLQDSFTEYYIVVVHLCHKFMKLSRTSGFKQFLSSYNDTVTRYEKELNTLADHIRDEMNIQSAVLAQEENKKSTRFRMLAKIDREALENRYKEQEKLRILDACSIYDYQTTWRQTRKLGNTALHKDDLGYQNWKAAACASTLVYSGRLGSGKSVLLANIIDDLFLNLEGYHVAYFFCQHDISESLKARTIVGSLTRQLLSAHGDFQQLSFPQLRDNNSFSIDDLSKIILAICSKLNKVVYFVIDGLDECISEEKDLFLENMKRCQESQKISLCVSLRWEPDVQSGFCPTQLTSPTYSSIPEQNPEVEAYINSEIDACINSGRLQIASEELIPAMKKVLGLKSKGMFLWVSLLITCVCSLTSDYDIIQALNDLPQSLAEIYGRLLDKYAATHKQYQEAILQLVSVAYRHLSTEELREALSIVPGETEWNTTKLSNNITGLLACCGGIVIIDEEELSVRLVHESARQFLMDSGISHPFSFTINDAERRMAGTVTTYLNFAVFDTQVSKVVTPNISGRMVVESVMSSIPQHSKFLKSISRLQRSSDATETDISRILAETAMQARPRVLLDLSLESYAKRYWFLHCAPVLDDSLIHDLTKKLLQRGPQTQMAYIPTPLSWAISNGYTSAFECLAAAGLPLEKTMPNAIQIAATKGHRDIVEKYLHFPELFLILDKDKLNYDLSVQVASNKWSSALKFLLNDAYVQKTISIALVGGLPTKGVLVPKGTNDQFINELLLEAVLREWPHILKPLSNSLTWTRFPWPFEDGIATRHKELAESCLDLLLSADCLSKQDICKLRTPGVVRSELDKQLISRHLPSEMQYACCNWTRHLRLSKCEYHSIKDRTYKFLQARFLFWFEAVSLSGRASEMTDMIKDLWEFSASYYPGLKDIIQSARRFVAKNESLVNEAPLQLYYSSIIFTPYNSEVVRNINMPNWLIGKSKSSRSNYSNPVVSITFSSDGKLLASGSYDGTINLWDVISGKLQYTFKGGNGWVRSLSFSPDGKFLASGLSGGTVELWDVISGRNMRTIEDAGHIVQFSLKNDLLQLHTDIGSFEIEGVPPLTVPEKTAETKSILVIKDSWLTRDGQRFIWLPPEYCEGQFAQFQGLIALSPWLQSEILLLEISFNELDRILREE